MRTVSSLMSLILVGCAMPTIPPELETRPAYLSDSETDAVKAGVRSALKDPNSANFGPIGAARYVRDDKSLLVCGWVNARNSYGGYTGMEPFMGVLGPARGGGQEFAPQLVGGREAERRTALQLCARQGVPLHGAGGYSL